MLVRRLIALLGCLAACVAAPSAAHARPGTHFLVELDAGATLSGNGGPAAALALGAGGKLKGFPARFYLLGRTSVSEYDADASSPASAEPAIESGSFRDFALGPRVYLPLIGPLRWFAEGLFGASDASGTFLEPGLLPLSAEQWSPLAMISSGLQMRIFYELSLGVRFAMAWNGPGLIGVERVAGLHDPMRMSVTGGVTWHF
jgi:hypothetical protein